MPDHRQFDSGQLDGRPILCYLDSQDYSTLTDPRAADPALVKIREDLLLLARSGQVRFAYSAVTISESTPLAPDHAHLATARAALLSELCGRNAFVSVERLASAELTALQKRLPPPIEVLDPNGQWYPDLDLQLETEEERWRSMGQIAEQELANFGLSRQQRRAAARKFVVKNGKPRPELRKRLAEQDPSDMVKGLISKYPMRPDLAEAMVLDVLGRGTENAFNDALQESLRDPKWMMMWFATQHSLASPVAEMVRRPGRELGDTMRGMVRMSLQIAQTLRALGHNDPTSRKGEITRRWKQAEDEQLTTLTRRLTNKLLGSPIEQVDAEAVATHCPGITAMVRSLWESTWQNIGGSRKELPSDSQPVDAMHACYAPYVDFFRADRFMAPHIQKQVHGRCEVVSKLVDLPHVLKRGRKV